MEYGGWDSSTSLGDEGIESLKDRVQILTKEKELV